MITLTQRLLASAVVKYKIDNQVLTLQIESNHFVSINTYCKINITGLSIVNDIGNNDIFNGTKIFKAISNTILETTVTLLAIYDNKNLQIISGTPVVNIVNSSWELESGRYLFQVATGGNVNWNNNKIKIYAEFNNQELSPITLYPENTSLATNEISINGRILTFEGQIDKVYIALNNIDNITNIPLLITKL